MFHMTRIGQVMTPSSGGYTPKYQAQPAPTYQQPTTPEPPPAAYQSDQQPVERTVCPNCEALVNSAEDQARRSMWWLVILAGGAGWWIGNRMGKGLSIVPGM